MSIFSIAIDGPAGSGKSTIAKIIASRLNIIYVDTGAMYRAMAFYFIKDGYSVEDREYVVSKLDDIDIELKYIDAQQYIFLNGEDVSSKIRVPQVSQASSLVSKIPEVREKLVSIQRNIASKQSVIMDGRDIGTHVLPNANPKIYLVADLEERAKRRCLEYKKSGIAYNYEEEKNNIKKRDYEDMHRSVSPLKKAEDAVEINTTDLTIEETAQKIIELISHNKER